MEHLLLLIPNFKPPTPNPKLQALNPEPFFDRMMGE